MSTIAVAAAAVILFLAVLSWVVRVFARASGQVDRMLADAQLPVRVDNEMADSAN